MVGHGFHVWELGFVNHRVAGRIVERAAGSRAAGLIVVIEPDVDIAHALQRSPSRAVNEGTGRGYHLLLVDALMVAIPASPAHFSSRKRK